MKVETRSTKCASGWWFDTEFEKSNSLVALQYMHNCNSRRLPGGKVYQALTWNQPHALVWHCVASAIAHTRATMGRARRRTAGCGRPHQARAWRVA